MRELAEEIGLAVPDLTGFVTLDTLSANGSFKDRVRVYHGTLNTPVHEIDCARASNCAGPASRKRRR